MLTEADTCRKYVLPKLYAAGWSDDQISEQKYFTDGRIVVTGRRHFRKPGKKADYLLNYRPDYRLAVVEAKVSYKNPADGLQQAMEYAEILGLRFAYSTNGHGIVEHDYTTGGQQVLDIFPSPDELWRRVRAAEGLADDKAAEDLLFPFNRELRNPDGSIKTPRYFQEIAIHRAVQAVLQGKPRILITMATGTGKTFVAVQIVWKLWKTGHKGRILYLVDRNILVDQPLVREFNIFGGAVWKIQGEAKKGREIYFALYQALAEDESRLGLYKEYPPDYFDLIIVDECHRGSATDQSRWRRILEYFDAATQIGMTATPRREETRDTYGYFGNPIYTYPLSQGIEDGFLAPYRVHRIVPSVDATGWRPERDQLDRFGREIPNGVYETKDFERVVSLLSRTEVVAQHLTAYLKRTDRFAKTMVFCVDQEHAEDMRAALHKANEDLTQQYPHYVARVTVDEGKVGRGHLDDFVDPERDMPVILTTSKLLNTGVDAPTCRNIVLFKPIGSIVEFKQIIGRGTRLYPDKDKLWFTILDYAGATRLFADPNFDGEPERITEERIYPSGEEQGSPVIVGEGPSYGGEEDEDVPVSDWQEQPHRKYYVDGVEVRITAEIVYELDSSGKQQRVVKYTDYTAEQVRRLYPTPAELRTEWMDAEHRGAIQQALAERGIDFSALVEATNQPDADPFDLLIHVAWNAPLRTRRERAESVSGGKGKTFGTCTRLRLAAFSMICWINTQTMVSRSSMISRFLKFHLSPSAEPLWKSPVSLEESITCDLQLLSFSLSCTDRHSNTNR
ncbi:Type I restriction enzyme EcoAI R protein (R.EcoAI) [Candidatus Methylomirabilis oxygeniifera]|uniref:Type I restriction enzyme EcoAI R protein (R.EcoAI) n=1 Tax=Methylomirabilis oxygeniifera TaxID=671143 RepID=D5MGZ2_METO1|nr:Type I restriction enzyme EcoAI R protein (R.EcoAI) [Candidatus Methylomirabilis oxyfera]